MTDKCIFSVDVEDWFHILDVPSTPPVGAWEGLPSRVEKNFRRLLEIFARYETRSTCFFLGWVAEKYPHLVREASEHGHEIASHGYSHTLVHRMSPRGFFEDARRTKEILEQIAGKPVLGYRAPGFSVTPATPWFFETLAQAGYRYDSSIFPAPHGHGGMREASSRPYTIQTKTAGELIEFPISVAEFLSRRVCLFGGGYLRLFPWWLVQSSAVRLMKRDQPVIFYVHPREIDCEHPRLAMSRKRAFKSYVNLRSTQKKVERILERFRPISFQQFLNENWSSFASGELAAPAAKARYANAGN